MEAHAMPVTNTLSASRRPRNLGMIPASANLPAARTGHLRLSAAAQQVLAAAWRESLAAGPGAPVDSADLLIGLLWCPRTSRVLAELGITEERVRCLKRDAGGYVQAKRFGAVAARSPLKTRQMGRIAELAAAGVREAGTRMIEPEDLLEVLIRDGLGWGVHILETLGLSEPSALDRLTTATAG
jgi:hypothetical protein